MLFYERSEELEPIEKLLQASVPSAPTPSNTPASGPLSKGLEVRVPVHQTSFKTSKTTFPHMAWLKASRLKVSKVADIIDVHASCNVMYWNVILYRLHAHFVAIS